MNFGSDKMRKEIIPPVLRGEKVRRHSRGLL